MPTGMKSERDLMRAMPLWGTQLCLVPREPGSERCEAGARAGDVSPEIAHAVYLAMLASDEPPATG